MKFIATTKSEQNIAAIDPWTAVHAGVGLAAGLVNMSGPTALLMAVSYEVVEQVFENTPTGQWFFETSQPETAPNLVADVAVYMLGWWLGRRWNESG